MRTCLILAAAALVVSGAATTAEARFRGGRSVHASRTAPTATAPRATGLGIGVGVGTGVGAALPPRPARSASAAADAAADTSATLRPVLPVTAPAPVREVRTAVAWCSDKRLVGSGAGFCEIN